MSYFHFFHFSVLVGVRTIPLTSSEIYRQQINPPSSARVPQSNAFLDYIWTFISELPLLFGNILKAITPISISFLSILKIQLFPFRIALTSPLDGLRPLYHPSRNHHSFKRTVYRLTVAFVILFIAFATFSSTIGFVSPRRLFTSSFVFVDDRVIVKEEFVILALTLLALVFFIFFFAGNNSQLPVSPLTLPTPSSLSPFDPPRIALIESIHALKSPSSAYTPPPSPTLTQTQTQTHPSPSSQSLQS